MLNDSGDSSDRRKARRILQKIVSDTGRANAIIQRLRNFVRKRAPRPQLHDASQLIRETLEIVESEKGRHGARIAVSIADSLRPVWVDRVQTRQVILHFVNNVLQAIDDAAEANRAIELTICENGEMIRVSLRDFAPGIPDHVRPRLFVPFLPPNRVDSAWDYR